LKHVTREVRVKLILLLSFPPLSSATEPFSSALVTAKKMGTTVVAEVLLVIVAVSSELNGNTLALNSALPEPGLPKFFPVRVTVVPGQPDSGVAFSRTMLAFADAT
jgi:hypothetical protein